MSEGPDDIIESYYDLSQEMQHITWRMPGWTMRLPPERWEVDWRLDHHFDIVFECLTIDSYKPDSKELVPLRLLVPILRPLRRVMVPDALRRAYLEAITHEADEWFEYDGVKIFNPHGHPERPERIRR